MDLARQAMEDDKRQVMALVDGAAKSALAGKAAISWVPVSEDIYTYLGKQAPDQWRAAFYDPIKALVADQAGLWGLSLGMQFDVANLQAQKWFEDYMLTFADPITLATSDALSVILQKATTEGWSLAQTRKTLDQTFAQWMGLKGMPDVDLTFMGDRRPQYRLDNIARTESMRAANAGSHAVFKDWGVSHKEWVATPDNRTRDAHRAADGQVVGIDDPFVVMGERLMYPGDPQGSPANFCQCRCTVAPVIKDMPTAPPVPPPAPPVSQPQGSTDPVQPASQPAAPPVQHGPKGTPCSTNVRVPNSKLWDDAKKTLGFIDRIHGDGIMGALPCVIKNTMSNLGTYWHFNSGAPKRLDLRTKGNSHQMNTMAHEMGHYLDHQAIPDQIKGVRAGGYFGSEQCRDHPKVAALMDAIEDSPEIKDLKDMAIHPRTWAATTGSGYQYTVTSSAQFVSYLLRRREMFARAYAQYIATKAQRWGVDGQKMWDEVQTQIYPIGTAQYYPTVWHVPNFEPIEKAFDDLFTDLGWMT